MRKIMLLIVFACFLLTGCTKTNNSVSTEQRTTQITLTAAKTYSGVLKNLIQTFEENNPDIRVNYVEMRGDLNKLYDIYTAPLNAKDSTVDVFMLDNVWIPNFGAKNFAEPLNYTFEEKRGFYDSILSECMYDGDLIAAPFSVDVGWIYYRKDLIETPPETWEEWIALGRQLALDGKVRYGGVIQGKDGEEMLCTAREFINACTDTEYGLKLYKEVLNLGGEDVNLDSTTYVKAFSMGEAAFMKAGSAAWQVINQDGSAVKMKVGIAPLPAGKSGRSASLLGGCSLAINRFSEKQEEAVRLVRYLTGEEAQTQAAVAFGIMPTLCSVYDNYRVIEENPHFNFVQTIGYSQFMKKGASVSYLEQAEHAEKYLEEFLSGTTDAKTAAAGIDVFLETKN